jgi:hypothetical protein
MVSQISLNPERKSRRPLPDLPGLEFEYPILLNLSNVPLTFAVCPIHASQVLRCISEGGAVLDKVPINPTFSFQFNASFTSSSKKFRIPMASLEDADRTKKLNEDRLVVIECAVVKTIKTHGLFLIRDWLRRCDSGWRPSTLRSTTSRGGSRFAIRWIPAY